MADLGSIGTNQQNTGASKTQRAHLVGKRTAVEEVDQRIHFDSGSIGSWQYARGRACPFTHILI